MRRNWMPLHIPDFLADTSHLSATETGAYLCLIMHYWIAGGLPDDDAKLAQIARLSPNAWRAMRPTIAAFFRDGWRHKRIDAELDKMIGMQARRQAAGVKGGTMSAIKRWGHANGHGPPGKQTGKQTLSNATANDQQTGKQTGQQTGKQTQANVKHLTQEEINNLSAAARARDGTEVSQEESGSAMGSVLPTDDLATVIKKKGWISNG